MSQMGKRTLFRVHKQLLLQNVNHMFGCTWRTTVQCERHILCRNMLQFSSCFSYSHQISILYRLILRKIDKDTKIHTKVSFLSAKIQPGFPGNAFWNIRILNCNIFVIHWSVLPSWIVPQIFSLFLLDRKRVEHSRNIDNMGLKFEN